MRNRVGDFEQGDKRAKQVEQAIDQTWFENLTSYKNMFKRSVFMIKTSFNEAKHEQFLRS